MHYFKQRVFIDKIVYINTKDQINYLLNIIVIKASLLLSK